MSEFLEEMLECCPALAKPKHGKYIHQGVENDRLFQATSEHVRGADCRDCHAQGVIQREERDSTAPEIHYGVIASGNILIKDSATRDRIVQEIEEECICFEMEAAGLMNNFPCLVVRGICDYADSHKNDRWQRYAAATAAAYTKELLEYVLGDDIQNTRKAVEVLNHS